MVEVVVVRVWGRGCLVALADRDAVLVDMEYSDLAGNFTMKPLRSGSGARDEESDQ